jgi:hypothetical protein
MIYEMKLVDEEDSRTCLALLKECVAKHGVFCSLYTDRGSHFFLTKKAGEKIDKNCLTQIGRALKELGVTHIPAYSPQARGRSERLFSTLQGRLPKELRLRGIKTKEAANEFIKTTYIRRHNTRFKVAPPQEGTAFVPVPYMTDLNKVFCFKHERTVASDNTISFKQRVFQIPESPLRCSFAKCKVTVYEHLDGSVTIGYGPHILDFYSPQCEPNRSIIQTTNKTKKGGRSTVCSDLKRTDHLLEKADILTC